MRPPERFLYWVNERENIRVKKEVLELPAPWTDDPILANNRFCNVNREDDRVTRWVKTHIRDVYVSSPRTVMITNIAMARFFNEPDVLAEMIPYHPTKCAKAIQRRREKGLKVFRAAYMMPSHGEKGLKAEDYWLRALVDVSKIDFEHDRRLEIVADKLTTVPGIADFLANQICTDLRYVPWYQWEDWGTFIRCGPGTRRGLDRYVGAEPTGKQMSQEDYQATLLNIRQEVRMNVDLDIKVLFQDPNNLANCFCEFDKYERARTTSSSLRKYAPTQQ